MNYLVLIFLTAAFALWLLFPGYPILLSPLLFRRPKKTRFYKTWPSVAVLVPTFDEEGFILEKLANLRKTDYPGPVSFYVVDGGSQDQTRELVKRQIGQWQDFHLMHVDGALGKSDQLNSAARNLDQEVIVVTDADAELEPTCIRECVSVLKDDDTVGASGAFVEPVSPLFAERLYCAVRNFIWWLEGQTLGVTSLCAGCYAVRRESFPEIPRNTIADDVHVAHSVGAQGLGVRLVRAARAREKRVPFTIRDFVAFRRRRGQDYLLELIQCRVRPESPRSWRFVRAFRIFQLSLSPLLLATVGVIGVPLLTGGQLAPTLALSGLLFSLVVLSQVSLSWSQDPNGKPVPFSPTFLNSNPSATAGVDEIHASIATPKNTGSVSETPLQKPAPVRSSSSTSERL